MSKALNAIKKIAKQQELPPDQIKELDLNGVQIGQLTPEIKHALEQYKNLEILNLSECDLSTLNNLPQLKKLSDLDLSTNSIPDTEIKHLEIYKALTSLNIADNQIEKIESVKQLKTLLPNLERLECADNKVESLPNYFKSVFAFFPKLQSLDNKDKDGNQVDNEDFEDFEDDPEYAEQQEGGNEDGDSDDDAEIEQDESYDGQQDGSEDSP